MNHKFLGIVNYQLVIGHYVYFSRNRKFCFYSQWVSIEEYLKPKEPKTVQNG